MPQTNDPIAQALVKGMRQLASGVSVMTANDRSPSAGDSSLIASSRVAMTVSSVTSLSDKPASLLVCVNKDTRMSSVISIGDVFAISVLSKAHEAVSTACAIPEVGDSRFEHGTWKEDEDSEVLYLEGAPAVFFCELVERYEYGTHYVCVGRLRHTKLLEDVGRTQSEKNQDPELLLYARGAYHYLAS